MPLQIRLHYSTVERKLVCFARSVRNKSSPPTSGNYRDQQFPDLQPYTSGIERFVFCACVELVPTNTKRVPVSTLSYTVKLVLNNNFTVLQVKIGTHQKRFDTHAHGTQQTDSTPTAFRPPRPDPTRALPHQSFRLS